MSLTDDMIRLKSVADNIAWNQRELKAPDSIVHQMENSYYEKRVRTSIDPEYILKEYDFETPIELRRRLEIMWEEMEKKEMFGFISVSMVACAKNKPEEGDIVKQEVSPFIYEF